jgi:hypothetical protein
VKAQLDPKSRTLNPDSRHQPLMEEIDFLYRSYNQGLPPPDMGRTAKALHIFLQANRGWPLRAIQRAMRNRFGSQEVNYSEGPWVWLKRLADYYVDPLNKWGKPLRGQGDGVFEYWEKAKKSSDPMIG